MLPKYSLRPCPPSHPKVWQDASTLVSQPLQRPTDPPCPALHHRAVPSAQPGLILDKTKLEEVPRQHRQSTSAASSPGDLPRATAPTVACEDIALEYQTLILLLGNLTNPFSAVQPPKTPTAPSALPKKQLSACLFRNLPNQHLQRIVTFEPVPFWTSLVKPLSHHVGRSLLTLASLTSSLSLISTVPSFLLDS